MTATTVCWLLTNELSEATENAVTELIKSSGSRKFDEAAHITSKGEYISIISSTYENWDVAVILKEQAFASKIIDIQKLFGCCCHHLPAVDGSSYCQ